MIQEYQLRLLPQQAASEQAITQYIAREKGYYVPASKATQQEVAHVKSILTQPTMK